MTYHLAQVNIARSIAPLQDPLMKDFVDNLDRINSLAESSPGFVWRLKDEDDNALSLRVFNDDRIIINLSVWESKKALFEFTYHSGHIEVFRRRKEWFEKLNRTSMALWYVKQGHEPSAEEAKERLEYIDMNGLSAYAFGFKDDFAPPN